MKNLLTILETTAEEVKHVLNVSHDLRDARGSGNATVLDGQTLAMFFEKPSLRTRVSFEQAMYELGGRSIVLGQHEVGLGSRESAGDVIRVLNGMVDGVMARVFDHKKLIEMVEYATVPVINALSDYTHPCQALADVMTMQDEFGDDVSGRRLVFIGDGNNVARSLAMISAKLGMSFVLTSPDGYAFEAEFYEEIRRVEPGADLRMVCEPCEAVAGADVIYCDTFVSMGQEDEKQQRLKDFAAYQVNDDLVGCASEHVIVLHCLPAYRGVEITDSVMDGQRSRVFRQSHNRLHAQKGLLAVLMGGC